MVLPAGPGTGCTAGAVGWGGGGVGRVVRG